MLVSAGLIFLVLRGRVVGYQISLMFSCPPSSCLYPYIVILKSQQCQKQIKHIISDNNNPPFLQRICPNYLKNQFLIRPVHMKGLTQLNVIQSFLCLDDLKFCGCPSGHFLCTLSQSKNQDKFGTLSSLLNSNDFRCQLQLRSYERYRRLLSNFKVSKIN